MVDKPKTKVQILVKDAADEIDFYSKTLTKFFPGKAGRMFVFSIKEPGLAETNIGHYTIGANQPQPTNIPPVVSAGEDRVFPDGTKDIILDGSASDPDGRIIRADWKQVGGPDISLTIKQDIEDITNATFIPKPLLAGIKSETYEFEFTAEDEKNFVVKDRCSITIGEKIPAPPKPVEGVLYDSNKNGKWNNGESRVVDKSDGDIKPNGLGLYTAASGSPSFEIDGKGVGRLITKPGYGRIYIRVCNYNARIEFEFSIESKTVDNMSIKGRSRHQSGGACENRHGGCGNATSLIDTDFKTEKCHNIHESGEDHGTVSKNLPQKLVIGKWYKKRYTYHDHPTAKAIQFKDEIDFMDGKGYVTVLEGENSHPLDFYMDKKMFDEDSAIWLRLNGSGSIAFKNLTVTAV